MTQERFLSRGHVQDLGVQMRVIAIPGPFYEPPGFAVSEAAADLSNALGREHQDVGTLVVLLVVSEDPEVTVAALALLHRRAGAARAIADVLRLTDTEEQESERYMAAVILGMLGKNSWECLGDLHLAARNDVSEIVRKAAANAIELITVDEVRMVRQEFRRPVSSRRQMASRN